VSASTVLTLEFIHDSHQDTRDISPVLSFLPIHPRVGVGVEFNTPPETT